MMLSQRDDLRGFMLSTTYGSVYYRALWSCRQIADTGTQWDRSSAGVWRAGHGLPGHQSAPVLRLQQA